MDAIETPMPDEILAELEEAMEVAQQKDARALLDSESGANRTANHIAKLREDWVTAIRLQNNPDAKKRFNGRFMSAIDNRPVSLEAVKGLLHGDQ
jgi:GTP1/Obg family GTP-binding protein